LGESKWAEFIEGNPNPGTFTNMFTDIDKKILITISTLLILLLMGGFFIYVYFYFAQIKSGIQDVNESPNTQEVQQENSQNSQDQINTDSPFIEIETETEDQSGFLVCVDKCGDGVCQQGEERCDNLNCICREDKQECPQDCK